MDTPDVRITIDELRSPDGDGLSLEQWAQLLVLLSHRKGVAVEVDTGGVGNSVLEVMRQYGVRCHPMPKVPKRRESLDASWLYEQAAFERGFQKGADWASGKRDAAPMNADGLELLRPDRFTDIANKAAPTSRAEWTKAQQTHNHCPCGDGDRPGHPPGMCPNGLNGQSVQGPLKR